MLLTKSSNQLHFNDMGKKKKKKKQGLCIPLLKKKIKHRDKTVIESLGGGIESHLQKLIEFLWGYSVCPCEGANSRSL